MFYSSCINYTHYGKTHIQIQTKNKVILKIKATLCDSGDSCYGKFSYRFVFYNTDDARGLLVFKVFCFQVHFLDLVLCYQNFLTIYNWTVNKVTDSLRDHLHFRIFCKGT